MKFLKRSAFLTTFLCFAAWGGLRGVGLGGGFGEMQAHLADQKLGELLDACMRAGCGVTQGDLDRVARDNRPLKTDTSCSGASSDAGAVVISSCDLYEFSPDGRLEKPRAFGEIAAIVFAERSGRPRAEAMTLLRDLRMSDTITPLTLRDGELSQHYVEVRLGARRFASLAVESLHESVEITSLLVNALNCPGGEPSWQIDQTNSFAGDHGHYLAESQIRWTCGESDHTGTLKLFVHYPDHRFEAVQLQLRR